MATFAINETARRTQFTSTGQTSYAFNFQVNAQGEVQVFKNDTLQTLTTHYTVSLNTDGTGTISFTSSHIPSSGDIITIIGDLALSRTTTLNQASDITTTNLDTEFDNVVIRQQQIKEITDRSIQLKPSTPRTVTGSGTSGPLQFPYDGTASNNANRIVKFDSNGTALELGSTTTNIDALAGIASDISTVSGISSNVTSVASNASNINTVAGSISNVNALGAISSDVTSVAGIASNVTTVAGKASLITSDFAADMSLVTSDFVTDMSLVTADFVSDVNTLATSDIVTDLNLLATSDFVSDLNSLATSDFVSDLNALEAIKANVTTVASNIADVNNFASVYRVGSSDPSSSLDEGDLFYNSTDNILKFYNGSSWVGISDASSLITVADESSDTSCNILFTTAATGNLAPKSGTNLTFNSSSGALTATSFVGDVTGNVTGNTSGSSGSCTGNSATATALETARNIGGVSFDGTGNIDLPGVNTSGNQNTSGTAATATALILDVDGDSSITSDTDDQIDIKVGNTDVAHIVNTGVSQGALLNRNPTPIVINGDMRIAQRGDQTGITAGQYINIDRFFINMINLGTWSFTQSTDNPGNGFGNSLKIDCTTADASPSAGDNFYLSMQTEGQNLQIMEKGTATARTSTLCYYIKSNKTGNYVVELWDRTNDRHVAKLVTISSANTWEKHVCNFPADTSGALANTNARSIMISWAFDSGTNFTSGTLPTTWASRVDANRFVGTNLGLGDNTANEVLITGVQWEMGTFTSDTTPPFQFEDAGTSLARCQRYFFKTFAQGTTPAQNTSDNNYLLAVGTDAGTKSHGSLNFPVLMRSSPTITTFNPFASNASARQPNSTTDVAYQSTTARDHSVGCTFQNTTTQSYHIHLTAVAEL